MTDPIEMAKEGIEQAHEAHTQHGDGSARNVAILISCLAAALALSELGEKGAQNAYLTHHITASDDWAFYQAKTIRSNLTKLHVETLESLPNAAEPAQVKRIASARSEMARYDDEPGGQGRKQLLEKASHSEHERDHQFHRYHQFEVVVGALQIAIVLASVSIVTRMKPLTIAAGLIGGIAAVYGAAIAGGVL